ncbi:MAG: redoxin family protein [Bacteroidota bacterium]
MKKYLLTTFITIVCSVAYAQQATVKVKFIAATQNKVMVQLPVDGTTFYPARVAKEFDKDSNLVINFESGKIANVRISNSDRSFKFLIEPGQTNITLDLSKKDTSSISYKGSSPIGQRLINARKYSFYQSRADKYLKKDSTATGVMSLIAEDKQKELRPFDELLQQQKISRAFYESIKAEISMDYLAIAAHIPISLYFEAARPNSKTVFKDEFKALWKDLYEKHPFTNLMDLNTTEYYYHAQYYSDYYMGTYLPQVKGTWVKPDYTNTDERFKNSYLGFSTHFTGKVREYLMASFLYNEMLQKKYQQVLIDLFNDFKTQYPTSNFSPFLKPMADEIAKYHIDVKKDFASDQKIMTNYAQVNSLDELMEKFKGKTVFVDIWATWCGPCKAEFEYAPELEKFLKSKNVEMLYISTDKEAVEQQWKDMIKYYKLAGSHIRTNELLLKDLINKLWGGKGYAIPRYLILKDGKLVVPDALRPSDKDKLYAQIANYL